MEVRERDPRAVESMFDQIAHRYDLLNSVLSGGTDRGWRVRAAAASRLPAGGRALDVACGTGKLALELARRAGPGGRVVGLDFSANMLAVAATHAPGPVYVRGDGLRLPFADRTFDAATVAFGLRNFADPVAGLAEMLRVLRPGGTAVVLEFVRPSPTLAGRAYRTYLRRGLPLIGGWLSGRPAAYRYLSDTVDSYRTPAELLDLATRAGWRRARIHLLTLGTVGVLAGDRD